MFEIKKSAMSRYSFDTGNQMDNGTNYSKPMDREIVNESPKTSFQNIKVGDVFNLFETMVLNSKWDIRDNNSGSTIILGREHMFYEEVQDEKEKIDKMLIENELYKFELIESPLSLFSHASSTLINNGITQGFDQTTEAILKDTTKIKKTKLEDILNRKNIRKFSEIHYALNGFNLIYSDIKTNEDVYNTVSYNYKNNSDKTVMVSLVPENNSRNLREVSLSPPYHICDVLESKENMNRNIEFFENMLLKNLENSYSGKIFIKFNPDIEIDDKIILIDNINSTFGMFKIETFEHRYTSDGLITVTNVKACVSISDPTLDVYAQSYLMKLHNDLKEDTDLKDNVVFTNIFSTIARIMYQLPKYGAFYNKEDSWLSSTEYPIKDNNTRANSLPIKFYPLVKKGKAYLPENIESCFYSTTIHTQSFMSALLKNIGLSVRGMFQDGREFALGTIRYTLDFLISMPTFGLHELLKPTFGLQYKKMMETFGKGELSDGQINLLSDNENFYSAESGIGEASNFRNPDKNIDYTVSFFNMKAQKEEGLFHFKNKEIAKATPLDKIRDKLHTKEQVSSMIANYSCDTMFAVEVYSGFKINKLEYTHQNFLKNVFGDTYEKHELTEDKFNGKEYGIIYSPNISKYQQYFNEKSYTVDISANRKAVISPMNIEEFNFKNTTKFGGNKIYFTGVEKTTNIINKIYFVWFHNYYGSKPDSIEERISIFNNLINVGNGLLSKDPEVGVVILGDFNLQIDNDRVRDKTPASSTNQNVVITKETHGFISCINKPTTLSSNSGNKFVNRFDNILISCNLEFFYNQGNIKTSINKYYVPNGVDRRDVSDHIPVSIHLKKNKE